MACIIKSDTHAATVSEVLSHEEWMDHQDVKDALGWGPDASASSVLSDMYTRRCPECVERRKNANSVYEYRLTEEVILS
jgi:hypothetical protein